MPNYHSSNPKFRYFNFEIAWWQSRVNESDESVIAFFSGVFKFIEGALLGGTNILVHCLAGAHRAGANSLILSN